MCLLKKTDFSSFSVSVLRLFEKLYFCLKRCGESRTGTESVSVV